MDNIVQGIRSRFFPTMSENAADEEDNVQKGSQKKNSRKDRRIHFEDEGLRSRSFSRRRIRSGREASFEKNKRNLMARRSYSYSSDESSEMSSDIEAVVAAAALAVSAHTDDSSSSNSSRENSPLSDHAQNSWTPLPGIGEEPSHSRRHYEEDVKNPVDPNSRALVPSSSMERKSKDRMALVPVPSRKDSRKDAESASGRWDKQIVPSGSGAYDRRDSSKAKESRKHGEIVYEESKKGKNEDKAAAWLKAEIERIDHRFGMKANGIHAWESERMNKADMVFKEVERKLNVKRTKAYERMKSEISRINKKAGRERAKMQAQKDAEIDEALRRTDKMRRSGREASTCCW